MTGVRLYHVIAGCSLTSLYLVSKGRSVELSLTAQLGTIQLGAPLRGEVLEGECSSRHAAAAYGADVPVTVASRNWP